jgi:FRG domain
LLDRGLAQPGEQMTIQLVANRSDANPKLRSARGDMANKAFSELIADVQKKSEELKREGKRERIWYRGVSSTAHHLRPSLHRLNWQGDILRKKEKNFFARFRTHAGTLIPAGATSWEILSQMQHHGAPTRILDWTESLFVGLYFALLYKPDPPSPRLWMLNPFALNERAGGSTHIFDCVDELPGAYEAFLQKRNTYNAGLAGAGRLKDDKAWPFELPVGFAPIWTHERVFRQRGYFTLHGSRGEPLDALCEDLVRCIDLADYDTEEVQRILGHGGIDRYYLFPDLENLATHLREA